MQFDTDNHIVKLCTRGMGLEGEGKPEQAYEIFQLAWNESTNDFEKFISAHYVARHQNNVTEKLKWDETALRAALRINDDHMKGNYPSLYLNIGKCYEDLGDFISAKKHYQLAFSFTNFLTDDGYAAMLKRGITNGIERVDVLIS